MNENLLKASKNAALTLNAIYEWLERIEANGGAMSISGVATCHSMLLSLRKNAARTQTLIFGPLNEAMDQAPKNEEILTQMRDALAEAEDTIRHVQSSLRNGGTPQDVIMNNGMTRIQLAINASRSLK